jgi:hypothetical protein
VREKIGMKPSYVARITRSGESGETELVAYAMLATSVTFVEALSAFLSNIFGQLTNDENKTSGKEAWYSVCSIVRWMFDDIAVHRRLASFVVVFENEEKQRLPTGSSRYSRVYHARVPTPPFDRADYQLPPIQSSSAVVDVQRSPGGNQ